MHEKDKLIRLNLLQLGSYKLSYRKTDINLLSVVYKKATEICNESPVAP